MTACLPDRTLWCLSEGDGTREERTHLAGCALCAWRARHMTEDLRLLVGVLGGEPPPPLRQERSFSLHALAFAGILLAVGIGVAARWWPPTTIGASQSSIAAVGEMSADVFGDDDDPGTDDADSLGETLMASAPCEWQRAGCRDLAQPLF